MAHAKRRETIAVGGEVSSGSRKLKLDAVDGDILEVTLTLKKGETVVVKEPRERDAAWITGDPGEGDMVSVKHYVKAGNKIRVGGWIQFRIFPDLSVVIVEHQS